MYTLTFTQATIDDLLIHRDEGRAFYGAVVAPYAGVFSHNKSGSNTTIPKIVCPYQVNDIISIQERWAQKSNSYVYESGDPFLVQTRWSKGGINDDGSDNYYEEYSVSSGSDLDHYIEIYPPYECVTVHADHCKFQIFLYDNASRLVSKSDLLDSGSIFEFSSGNRVRSGDFVKYRVVVSTDDFSPIRHETTLAEDYSADDFGRLIQIVGRSNADRSYNFRPSTMMPTAATRMYGRIVSVRPWNVTKQMIDNYLYNTIHSDACSGSAKVVNYYTVGGRLLSNSRKARNQQILSKLSQPVVPVDPPMVTKDIYYMMRDRAQYSLSWNMSPEDANAFGQRTFTLHSKYTLYAQINYSTDVPTIVSGDPSDNTRSVVAHCDQLGTSGDAWSTTIRSSKPETYQELYSIAAKDHIFYRGKHKDSTTDNPKYVYIHITNEFYALPRFATYKTQIVDPSLDLHAWMISGYLCDKDGNAINGTF